MPKVHSFRFLFAGRHKIKNEKLFNNDTVFGMKKDFSPILLILLTFPWKFRRVVVIKNKTFFSVSFYVLICRQFSIQVVNISAQFLSSLKLRKIQAMRVNTKKGSAFFNRGYKFLLPTVVFSTDSTIYSWFMTFFSVNIKLWGI